MLILPFDTHLKIVARGLNCRLYLSEENILFTCLCFDLLGVDASSVEPSMEALDDLLLAGTDFELVYVAPVLPDFAAAFCVRTLVDVRTAACEAMVQAPLEVLDSHFGCREAELVVLAAFFFNVRLTGLQVVDGTLAEAIAALVLRLLVVVRSPE